MRRTVKKSSAPKRSFRKHNVHKRRVVRRSVVRRGVLKRQQIRAALSRAHGIVDRAARALGVPRTTLQNWLAGSMADLQAFAAALRAKYAPEGPGRPWTVDGMRTRVAVARAWKASGYRLAVAARILDVPRTSLRHLVHRYELPHLPASGRGR
jgi:transcriptional regulator with GAF, ATPase, and Fis domain